MFFFLSSTDYINRQSYTTKIKVHLKNGIAEILENHQDLMGLVQNNLIEIENNFENKVEKFVFIVQDAVFIVSNKGLDPKQKGMAVYVYAKNAYEINSSLPIEELSKIYEQKKAIVERETEEMVNTEGKTKILSSEISLLKDDVEFLKKTIFFAKQLK
jgi:hypothetical protein